VEDAKQQGSSHEGFWRAVVVLMLVALVGVGYLAWQLRPRTPLATPLAYNYKPTPQPVAPPEEAKKSDEPKKSDAQASPPEPVRKASNPAGGIAATPLRRFLPTLRSGFDEAQLNQQLGIILASLSRHEEAVRAYTASLERTPQNATAWVGLGISFEALGKRREALDAYQRALKVGSVEAEDRAFAERRVRELQ
jgi:tetratricopeptide (TPR) repeat protein